MIWHANQSELSNYASGAIVGARAQSIEQHLGACAQCRRVLAAGYGPERMMMVWTEVIDELDQPRQPWLERLLRWFGASEQIARLVAVTPSLRWSWMVGVMITLTFCVVSADAVGAGTPVLFFAVAPLVPLAAVAVAFGHRFDPTAELTQSMPVSSFRLLLARVASVLVATIPLVLAAELLLDTPGVGSARWLLPSLAMVSATMALSTRFDAAVAALLVGASWVALLVVVITPTGTAAAGDAVADFFAFGAAGQMLSAALALLGAMWVFRKRDAIEIRRFV
jgi:hypothetical protein